MGWIVSDNYIELAQAGVSTHTRSKAMLGMASIVMLIPSIPPHCPFLYPCSTRILYHTSYNYVY